jgi:hypothetical protein
VRLVPLASLKTAVPSLCFTATPCVEEYIHPY